MNEKKLKAFLLSVQEGSFSKAAEKLGYTQSALTQMMHSFEEELKRSWGAGCCTVISAASA